MEKGNFIGCACVIFVIVKGKLVSGEIHFQGIVCGCMNECGYECGVGGGMGVDMRMDVGGV